jgi:hypothetical protein
MQQKPSLNFTTNWAANYKKIINSSPVNFAGLFYFNIMKHSQSLGILAALLLIGSCYLPWIEITSLQKTITGVNGYVNENYTFGKQILAHSFFSILAIICFLIPKVGAKRTNIFLCFLNFSWAIKNFILFKLCRNGDCPTAKIGLYLVVLLAFVMIMMSLLPTLEVNKKRAYEKNI